MISAFYKTAGAACQIQSFSIMDISLISRDFFVKHVVILITIMDMAPFRVAFSQLSTDWR